MVKTGDRFKIRRTGAGGAKAVRRVGNGACLVPPAPGATINMSLSFRKRLLSFIEKRPLDTRDLVYAAAKSGALTGQQECIDYVCDKLAVNTPGMWAYGWDELQLLKRIMQKRPELKPGPDDEATARKIAGVPDRHPVLLNQKRWFVLMDDGHPAADGRFRITIIDAVSKKILKTIGAEGGRSSLSLPVRVDESAVRILAKYQGVIHTRADFFLDDDGKPTSPLPDQIIIKSQADYDRFVARIPASVPLATKGADHANDDPLRKKPVIDFSQNMMIVVVQKESMYRCPDIISITRPDGGLVVTYAMPDLRQYAGAQEDGNGTYCAVIVPRSDGAVTFMKRQGKNPHQ